MVWYKNIVEMASKDSSSGPTRILCYILEKIKPKKKKKNKHEEAQVWIKISRNKSEGMGSCGYSFLSITKNLTFGSDSIT